MDRLIFVFILLGIIVLIMFFQYINSLNSDKIYISKLNKDFGQIDKSTLKHKDEVISSGYFNRHRHENSIDDITWNDLSYDQFFSVIDSTQSAVGLEVLYYMLRTPLFSEKEIEERRRMLLFWCENADLRNRILLILHNIGNNRKYSIYDYLDSLDDCETVSTVRYLIQIGLLILAFGSMFFLGGYGVIIFLSVLIFNLYCYYRDKNKIAPYVSVLDHIYRIYIASEEIIKRIDAYSSDNDELKKHSDELAILQKKLQAFKRLGGSSSSNFVILIINTIGFIAFADLLRFNKLKKMASDSYEDLDRLIYEVGSFDAEISMASYIKAVEENSCIPQFVGTKEIIIKGLYHPLIKEPVANDIVIDNALLLTGANASGKSTFLKSISISMIMAQTLTVVCAEEYIAPLVCVMSSMSLRDDVFAGDSYYMAEIKAIKRIFDKKICSDDVKLVCFVDELLRGTNTTERIAASTQILRMLAQSGTYVCAATHDLELTSLLNDTYDNYHFKEDLSDGDVKFSYRILPGPATTKNAILLLQNVGFSSDITKMANQMVSEFESSGVWRIGKD